ncbi:hypothetical protein [Sulfuracidifex metallicus]|nr:hypothetical protein [Sulfuracidifex metallicus]MCY0851037.1 hypothetical protein [Sulfuracidifex metallicus]
MEMDNLHMGISALALFLIAIVLLIELGYLDIEMEPEAKYYGQVDKWI